MKMVNCLPLPVNIIGALPDNGSMSDPLRRVYGRPEESGPVLSRQRPLKQKRPLPVFTTSRSHQLTPVSGFGGTPSPSTTTSNNETRESSHNLCGPSRSASAGYGSAWGARQKPSAHGYG